MLAHFGPSLNGLLYRIDISPTVDKLDDLQNREFKFYFVLLFKPFPFLPIL